MLSALVPIAQGSASDWWFWRRAAAGHAALLGVDLVALGMAGAFAALARATARRARNGDGNSVWA